MDLLAQPILDNYNLPEHPVKKLGIIWVGNNSASELYINLKQQKAATYGINTRLSHLPELANQEEIIHAVEELNQNTSVDGIIVQLPLPNSEDTDSVLDAIDPEKDVDNLTGSNHFVSPMVRAVDALLKHYNIDLVGKKVCVVGQGRLVGQPIVHWLEHQNIDPTIIPSAEEFDDQVVLSADIIIAGTGSKHIINEENTRAGQVIIDCSGKDADYEAVKDKVSAITPPKGGIGPLTVHFLLTNVLLTQ